jgi:magnesium-transporting ATPase (P-type)
MDVRTIIQGMTVWNWLSLIAVFALPFTFINALLSLKSRYRDWQGIKSKKKFDKRLGQMKSELVQIENHSKNLPAFMINVLAKAMPLLSMFFISMLLFMGAFTIFRLPLPGFWVFEFVYLVTGIIIMMLALVQWRKLTRLIESVNNPKDFAIELLDFIYAGKKKRFIESESEFVDYLTTSEIFKKNEQLQLQLHAIGLDADRRFKGQPPP